MLHAVNATSEVVLATSGGGMNPDLAAAVSAISQSPDMQEATREPDGANLLAAAIQNMQPSREGTEHGPAFPVADRDFNHIDAPMPPRAGGPSSGRGRG